MSSYEKVKGGKLSFKGPAAAAVVDKKIQKKKKKKKDISKLNSNLKEDEDADKEENAVELNSKEENAVELNSKEENAGELKSKKASSEKKAGFEIDTGTGFSPDGKKSKHYEALFPVETKRFGYDVSVAETREAALDERVKRKADRYCK